MVARTGFNDRRQPFQGWILPRLSIDSARHSSEFLPDSVLLIGAKMEPSCTNLSLPRFASIRHSFDVPADLESDPGSFDNRFLGDSCYRRESGSTKRNSNKPQEHGRTGWRSRSS